MRAIAWSIGWLLLVCSFTYEAQAATVTATSPIRIDFTLPVAPPFTLPASILSQTVLFGRDNPLGPGEGYEVLAFDALGNFLGSGSFTNAGNSFIIGCACTDEHLNPYLTTASGHLILRALSGSFNVTDVVIQACDDPSQNACGDSVTTTGTISLVVAIDIKPRSDENRINLHSNGPVPVAILGSPTFDATQVDPATVRVAGARVGLIGKSDKSPCDLEDVNDDGYFDLVCRVRLADSMLEVGDTIAVLEARTFAGERIRGEDSIKIVP
jgi:hypothetical protein